jgi:hypothetical protein
MPKAKIVGIELLRPEPVSIDFCAKDTKKNNTICIPVKNPVAFILAENEGNMSLRKKI